VCFLASDEAAFIVGETMWVTAGANPPPGGLSFWFTLSRQSYKLLR
jgi:hypothetical protein